MKTADPKAAAARAFVRSLNILLKLARLYGYDHVRTAEQLQIAWEELREAIPEGTESGLLLGASGAQLLLDGVPLEGAPAEKQFAQLLSTAGLASIQFYPCITEKRACQLCPRVSDRKIQTIRTGPTTERRVSRCAGHPCE